MKATESNETKGGLPVAAAAGVVENAIMNNVIVEYMEGKCVWTNGTMLAKKMQAERQAWALTGFFFDYELGETKSFKRYCKAVETAAGFMMGAAKREGCSVRIFKNMNGEIACALNR